MDLVARMNNIYDRIARRAFEIFDGDGRPFGRDLAHWLMSLVRVELLILTVSF
jgi:hypothetical protein